MPVVVTAAAGGALMGAVVLGGADLAVPFGLEAAAPPAFDPDEPLPADEAGGVLLGAGVAAGLAGTSWFVSCPAGIESVTEGSGVFNEAATGADTRLATVKFIDGSADGSGFRIVVALRVSRPLFPTSLPPSNESIAESAAVAFGLALAWPDDDLLAAGESSRLEPVSDDETMAAPPSGLSEANSTAGEWNSNVPGAIRDSRHSGGLKERRPFGRIPGRR